MDQCVGGGGGGRIWNVPAGSQYVAKKCTTQCLEVNASAQLVISTMSSIKSPCVHLGCCYGRGFLKSNHY